MTTHAHVTRSGEHKPPLIPKRLLTQEERVRTLVEQLLNEITINDKTGFAKRLEQLAGQIDLVKLVEENDPRKVEQMLTKILDEMYETHGRFKAPETTIATVTKEQNGDFLIDVATQYERDTLLDQLRQVEGVQDVRCIAKSSDGVLRIRVRIDTSKLNGNGGTPIEEKVKKRLLCFPLAEKNQWAQFELERSYIVELAYRINEIRKLIGQQEINWISVGEIGQELDDAEQMRDMYDLPTEQTWRLFGSRRDVLTADGRTIYGLTLRNGHDGSNYKQGVNEDGFVLRAKRLVLGDGMGGHASGEKANQFALDELDKREGMEAEQAIREVNDKFSRTTMKSDGSGTTISVVDFSDDTILESANLGDSPIWLKTVDGRYICLFEDHSMPTGFVFNSRIEEGWTVRAIDGQRFIRNPQTSEEEPLSKRPKTSVIGSAIMGKEIRVARRSTQRQFGIVELASDGMDYVTDMHIETTDPVIHAERSARTVILNYHPTSKRDDATIVCANVLDEVQEIQKWQEVNGEYSRKVGALEWFLTTYQQDARIARVALDAMKQIGHYRTEEQLAGLTAPDTVQYAREKRREVLVRGIRLAAEGDERALGSLEQDTEEYGSQIASELLDNLPRIAQFDDVRAIRICRALKQHELDGQVERLTGVERQLVDILEVSLLALVRDSPADQLEDVIRRIEGLRMIGDTDHHKNAINRTILQATERLVAAIETTTQVPDNKIEMLRKILWEHESLPKDSAQVISLAIERICEPLYLEQRNEFRRKVDTLMAENENIKLGFANAEDIIRYMETSGLLTVTASNEQNYITLGQINNEFGNTAKSLEQEAVLRMTRAENKGTRQKGYTAIGKLYADGTATEFFGRDELVRGIRTEKGRTRELARTIAYEIGNINTGRYLIGRQVDIVKDGLQTTDGKIASIGVGTSSALHLASIAIGGSVAAVVVPAVSLVGVLGFGAWYIGRKGKKLIETEQPK